MEKIEIGYGTRITTALGFEQAVEKISEALISEGFGIITKIDVQATLKTKLEAEFRQYVILGACNPSLAYQALNLEIDIGLLLPCNVVVYEQNGESVIALVDPISMLGVVDNPELDPITIEAKERFERVAEKLRNQ
jgi:uncharacterized protein (DUF302 family)